MRPFARNAIRKPAVLMWAIDAMCVRCHGAAPQDYRRKDDPVSRRAGRQASGAEAPEVGGLAAVLGTGGRAPETADPEQRHLSIFPT
jgi:hypothetical protein